jgi:hypothetical protein
MILIFFQERKGLDPVFQYTSLEGRWGMEIA